MAPYVVCSASLIAAMTLSAAACAAVALVSTAARTARRNTQTVEQWLICALQQKDTRIGLPSVFVQELLRCECRDTSTRQQHVPDAGRPGSGVVLDRPYVQVLATRLEAVVSAGVWLQPPQVRNPELVALEIDSSAEQRQWAAAVISTLSGGLDETTMCNLLAALGTRGIVSLLGQR